MTSRCVKPMLALVLVLGVGLALAPRTTAAPAAGLNWELNGSGSGSPTSSSGVVLGQYVGSGTYSVTITSMISLFEDSSCFLARGSGTITAADGSGSISFLTEGLLCPDLASVYHYNATFRITGGSNRFSAAAGGGSLALTYGSTNYLKMDGTITF